MADQPHQLATSTADSCPNCDTPIRWPAADIPSPVASTPELKSERERRLAARKAYAERMTGMVISGVALAVAFAMAGNAEGRAIGVFFGMVGIVVAPFLQRGLEAATTKCLTCSKTWRLDGQGSELIELLQQRLEQARVLCESRALTESRHHIERVLKIHEEYGLQVGLQERDRLRLLLGCLCVLVDDRPAALANLRPALRGVAGDLLKEIGRMISYAEADGASLAARRAEAITSAASLVGSIPLTLVAGVGRLIQLPASQPIQAPISTPGAIEICCRTCGNELLACHTHRCLWCSKCARILHLVGERRLVFGHPRMVDCAVDVSDEVKPVERLQGYQLLVPPPSATTDPGRRSATSSELSVDRSAGLCLVCRTTPAHPVTCPRCSTATCSECWNYCGGCPLYGCDVKVRA